MPNEEKMWAWYSKEQHKALTQTKQAGGTYDFRTGKSVIHPPAHYYKNADGAEVLCTQVTHHNGHGTGFADMAFVGNVVEYSRPGPDYVEIDPKFEQLLKDIPVNPVVRKEFMPEDPKP